MDTIEHKGLEIEFTPVAGEPSTRDYPGADPYMEIDSARVSDWDEFAECWGANGETPIIAASLDSMIETILDKEQNAIEDAAWELVNDWEPDCDDGDDYWDDHDPYGGGYCGDY